MPPVLMTSKKLFIILSCQNKVGPIPKRIIAVVLGCPPGQENN